MENIQSKFADMLNMLEGLQQELKDTTTVNINALPEELRAGYSDMLARATKGELTAQEITKKAKEDASKYNGNQ